MSIPEGKAKGLLLLGLLLCSACYSGGYPHEREIEPFGEASGCLLGPSHRRAAFNQYRDCCDFQRFAYWVGGSQADKREAQQEFRACLEEFDAPKALVDEMVRYEPRWGWGGFRTR